MSLTIYTVSGAPRGWRVLLGLAFKEKNYHVEYLEKSAGDLDTDEFLQINPRATVPVLKLQQLVLHDSIGILAWLDRQYPEKPLFGVTAQEAALIWDISMQSCDYLRAANHGLLSRVFASDGSALADNDELQVLQEHAQLLNAEFDYLEEQLNDRQFLGSQQAGAADAIVYPEVRLVQRAMETKSNLMDQLGFKDIHSNYPQLVAWKKRIEDMPGVANTFPIHWS